MGKRSNMSLFDMLVVAGLVFAMVIVAMVLVGVLLFLFVA